MTACVLAWTSLGMSPQGRVRACGKSIPNASNPSLKQVSIEAAWNSDYYKTLRLDMLNGVENSNCAKCHLQEKLEGTSKRLQINADTNIDLDYLRSITNIDGNITTSPTQIDIRVGNICNLKCVHCWTGNSSKWYEDKLLLDRYENTENIKFDNTWISDNGSVWQYVKDNIDTIESLNILGGEPFASKQHNELLDWLVEHNKTDVSLFYVTNATLLTPTILDKLRKFKHVELGISLDDTFARAEFMRFPNNWKTLQSIFEYINQYFDTAYFNWTCHNLNFYQLADTYKYCADNYSNIKFKLGDFVITPAHMSVQNLPLSLKDTIKERVKDVPGVEFYINYMYANDLWATHSSTLLDYLNDLDTIRKTNWKTTFPEITKLYE